MNQADGTISLNPELQAWRQQLFLKQGIDGRSSFSPAELRYGQAFFYGNGLPVTWSTTDLVDFRAWIFPASSLRKSMEEGGASSTPTFWPMGSSRTSAI